MSDDYIGVKIDGVIYVKLDDVKPMRTRIEKLEAALRFYGDKHHWRKQRHRDLEKDFWTFAAQDDGGKVARKALEGKDD